MQNSNFKIISIIVFGLFLIATSANAGALDISRIGVGARSLGLGRAQVAGRDVGAAFVNPANLAEFETFSMTSMYANLSEDVMYNMFGAVFPLKEGSFGCIGIGFIGAGVTGILVTSAEARTGALSTTDYSNRLLTISYGKDLNSFVQMGVAAKFLTRSFETVQNGSATGTDLDVGFLVYPRENVAAGFTLQNILNTQLAWKNGATEDITSNIKMGVNIAANKFFSLLMDYDSNQYVHSGIEWKPKEFLALRFGSELVPTGSKTSVVNFSAGVGLDLKGLRFDYAYYVDTLLSTNSTHYMSISYTLPEKTVDSQPILPANISNPSVALN